MANKAVFIDRDGTMARDAHYCSCPEEFELFTHTAKAIRLLNDHAFKVIVVTNQSGIARGYFTEETLVKIHGKMRDELTKEGAFVSAIYHCPHHPDEGCDCRKPKPKLVYQAVKDYDIDLQHSFVVGDLGLDVELGKNVGCMTILIGDKAGNGVTADCVADNLLQAVDWILSQDEDSNLST
ncbi:D-glycero-alpha-D-manno-heptose-1,7-bisphosphate 7-phosphatase [Chloroflexota bacterium]